jgi:hypothetical protein
VSTIIKGGILEYDKINIEQDLNIAGNTYTNLQQLKYITYWKAFFKSAIRLTENIIYS